MPKLDGERKKALIDMEFGGFMKSIGQSSGFSIERTINKGISYTIYVSNGDPDGKEKSESVHRAIEIIRRNGFALPKDIRVYCTQKNAQNRAFHRDPEWNEICYVILGPNAAKGGSVDSISRNPPAGFNHATITCIHEIGHNLHEKNAGDLNFWGTGSDIGGAPDGAIASQVSGYALNTKKEFIAEVFAGINIKKKYSKAVIDYYNQLLGPAGSKLPAGALVG